MASNGTSPTSSVASIGVPRVELTAWCGVCKENITAIVDLANLHGDALCQTCGYVVCSIRMVRGLVYILSNPSMPGRLKIGFTCRTIDERIVELSNATGVPEPFVAEAYFHSDHPERDEAQIHELLNEFRLANKEFFSVPLGRAIEVCLTVCNRAPHYVRPAPERQAALPSGPEPYGDNCRRCGTRIKQHGGRTGWCKRCKAYWPMN